ncbi:hypothetical protein ACFLUV_02370 [Elusimicrobiota bacterium]
MVIDRETDFYTKELLDSTQAFDGKENRYCRKLADSFNTWLIRQPDFSDFKLKSFDIKEKPDKVIWVDASSDKLPATRESCRVIGNGTVVNNRDELLKELNEFPSSTLVLSQCVKKECYDHSISLEIEKMGSVPSPGPVTAPGSLLSDKLKTYDFLSKREKKESLVAKYYGISPGEKSSRETALEILDIIDKDDSQDSFFVKPTEGGGGLGGFRLLKVKNNDGYGYVIPDLSKLSGDIGNPHPVPLTVNADNPAVIEELWWLYNRFASIDVLRKNYINIELKNKGKLKDLLKMKQHKKIYNRQDAIDRLTGAIDKFELKFNRKYHPIVCHYIDFGTWGLRAHYRLTAKGILLETMYARIFQVRFEEDGIGYVGSDNISNKQTGELELGRLVPVNKFMVKAAGGKKRLYNILSKGALALKYIAEDYSSEVSRNIPIRVQFDIAPVAGLIGEGNADTARGFCIAQDWGSFKKNIKEWYEDSITYYNFKKYNILG